MHNFCKKCLGVDYTSKYCLLSIELSFECIYIPQHTNFGCLRVHVASSVFLA